jgi:iron complex transport system ATP-binding protein
LSKDITDEDVKRAKQLLIKLRLGNKMAQPFALMSKGERQCVLIARALISNPEILILDEPGTGLDIYAREYVLQAIADLAETTDMTIIYVTHYVEEILPMFDKTILMKDGYIVEQGKTGEMFENERLSQLLGYPVVATQDALGNVRVKLEVESTFRDLNDVMQEEVEG